MTHTPEPFTALRAGSCRRTKYWLKGDPQDFLPVILIDGQPCAIRGRRGCKTSEEAIAKAQRRLDAILREIRKAGK